MENKPLLSIIIPLYNSEKYLPSLFNSISNQSCLNDSVELVLIDNGSTDNSKSIIDDYIEHNSTCRIKYLYFNQVADSYAARNYGVKNCEGDILAFTDSDCILEHRWIENIFSSSKAGTIIAGEIEIIVTDNNSMWEVFDSFAHLNNKDNASKGKVATANLIVTKSDFMKVGFFEERFSGGDHEWSLRAQKEGFEIVYNGLVKVFHPSRKTYSEIINKSKRIAFGIGVDHEKKKKSIISLCFLFGLKFLYFRSNFIYSNQFRKRGFGNIDIMKFNICFVGIRWVQFNASIQGYRNMNARKLGIK